MKMITQADARLCIEQLAGKMYKNYCSAVGGKAFNGDPLPDWKTFRADPSKKTQSDAWIVAANTAIESLCEA